MASITEKSVNDAINSVFLANANKPREDRSSLSFHELLLTEQHRTYIAQMITDLALNNIFLIALKALELPYLGDKIFGVHALKILECSLTNPDLKTKMQTIFNYSTYSFSLLFLVKNGFFNGLARCMEENEAKDTLRYLPDFAISIHKQEEIETMKKAIEIKKRDGFFRLCIEDPQYVYQD